MAAPCKPVTIRGVEYKSHVKAAEALGVSPSAVRQALKRGDVSQVGLHKRYGRLQKPTSVGGVTYPSRLAACRAIGVHYAKLIDILQAEKEAQQ